MLRLDRFSVVYEVIKGELAFPDFAGITIRGAIGFALRDLCCTLEQPACEFCDARGICAYEHFFAPAAEIAANGLVMKNVPRPCVIQAWMLDGQSFSAGDRFSFRITLFGARESDFKLFRDVFGLLGTRGIGKESTKCRLLDFARMEEAPFSFDLEGACRRLLGRLAEKSGETSAVLYFKTPFRFKYKGRIGNEVPFHVFIRTLLRRLVLLETYFGDGEPDIAHRRLIDLAEAVRLCDSRLSRRRIRRVSSRQRKSLSLSGLVGTVAYEGSVSAWLPLLNWGGLVHVGKATSFGLGAYDVLARQDDSTREES